MKKVIFQLIIINILFWSCKKIEDWNINEKCLSEKPETGDIYVNVSINNNIKSVPIEIRLNNYHSGQLIIRDTLTTTEKVYEVEVNNYYVVSAEYVKDKIKTTSIDGGKVSTRKVTNEDGSECWNLRNFRARVQLN